MTSEIMARYWLQSWSTIVVRRATTTPLLLWLRLSESPALATMVHRYM